jgi:hypothetical protein
MSVYSILDRIESPRQDFGSCQLPKHKALPQHLGACIKMRADVGSYRAPRPTKRLKSSCQLHMGLGVLSQKGPVPDLWRFVVSNECQEIDIPVDRGTLLLMLLHTPDRDLPNLSPARSAPLLRRHLAPHGSAAQNVLYIGYCIEMRDYVKPPSG